MSKTWKPKIGEKVWLVFIDGMMIVSYAEHQKLSHVFPLEDHDKAYRLMLKRLREWKELMLNDSL